jgi:hypothetical protein
MVEIVMKSRQFPVWQLVSVGACGLIMSALAGLQQKHHASPTDGRTHRLPQVAGSGVEIVKAEAAPTETASADDQPDEGGQTLPSAYFLKDDVQFFPPGPESQLNNQIQKLDEYRLEQEAIEEGSKP